MIGNIEKKIKRNSESGTSNIQIEVNLTKLHIAAISKLETASCKQTFPGRVLQI